VQAVRTANYSQQRIEIKAIFNLNYKQNDQKIDLRDTDGSDDSMLKALRHRHKDGLTPQSPNLPPIQGDIVRPSITRKLFRSSSAGSKDDCTPIAQTSYFHFLDQ
jgi:hypothetical protein